MFVVTVLVRTVKEKKEREGRKKEKGWDRVYVITR